jgi:uroporphyrinogen-III synthase
MRPTIILTRPAADSTRLSRRLAAHKFRTWQQPLLEICALDDSERIQLPALGARDIVIYVSANAVIHGLESVLEAASERPISMAVGRRTAATLRSSGVEPLVPAREDSEGLLALPQLQVVAQRRIVLVKGPGGRELIADTLRERGAEVIEFNCYRRQYIPLQRQLIASQIAPLKPLVWVAGSGGVVEHLGRQLAQNGFRELQAQALIVPSVRVALMASKHGWLHVLKADDASDTSVVSLLDRTYP